MSTWLKLLIPIGLGVAAMVLNYMAGRPNLEAQYYIMVNQDMLAGEKFTSSNISSFELRGARSDLSKSAILWTNRSVLFDQACGRDMKKGDIVFWRDANPPPAEMSTGPDEVALNIPLRGISSSLPALLKVGDEIGFYVKPKPKKTTSNGTPTPTPPASNANVVVEHEYLGPFRVIAIGKKIDPEDIAFDPSGAREISIAVKQFGADKKLDEMHNKLLEVRTESQVADSRIAALVLHAKRQKHDAKNANEKK